MRLPKVINAIQQRKGIARRTSHLCTGTSRIVLKFADRPGKVARPILHLPNSRWRRLPGILKHLANLTALETIIFMEKIVLDVAVL